MMDKKFADQLLGLGNSRHFCHLCDASKEEMRDVEKIREGKATINLNNTDSWPVFRIPNE